MKKNRAICNFIFLTVLVIICFVFSFVGFILPTTNYYFKGFVNSVPLGYDFDGGVMAIYNVEKASYLDQSTSEVVDNTINRVYQLLSADFNEPIVKKVNDSQIKVVIPASTISSDYLVGEIEFTTAKVDTSDPDATEKIMTSEHIKSASYVSNSGSPGVYIEFNDDGKQIFEETTKTFEENSSGTLYIYADKSYSSPVSAVSITTTQTSGYLYLSGGTLTTRAIAEAFADKITSSLVGANMTIDGNELIISSTIENVIFLVSSLILLGVIIASFIYLFFKYRQAGLIAILSLSIFILVDMIIVCIPEFFQLSIYSMIASIILYAFGFWTHALYLENSKRECSLGKKLINGFKSGYNKTYNVLIDTCAIGFVFSLVGFLMGSGAIKSVSIVAMFSFPVIALTSILLFRGLIKWYLYINLTDYKKVNFTKGETVNE